MKLRKQLLVVSLAALVLPWAGVQYLRAIEQVLRAGQVEALQATANAIAAVVGADKTLTEQINAFAYSAEYPEQPLVAQRLSQPAQVDGYSDEWVSRSAFSGALLALDSSVSAQVMAGVYGSQLYLFVTVRDSSRQFYNPSRSLSEADFVRLNLPRLKGVVNLFTAAPGRVQVQVQSQGQKAHYPIQGVWYESAEGYQLELAMPRELAEQGIQLQVFDGRERRPILHNAARALPLVFPPRALQQALAAFDKPSERVYLTSNRGFVLGSVGSLTGGEQGIRHPVIIRFIHWLLGVPRAAEWRDPLQTGRFEVPAQSAQAFEQSLQAVQTLNYGSNRVYRVYAPVTGKTDAGFIVVEKNATALNALITGATGKLVLYSLLAFLLVGFVCIGYASWLSYRIRRLNKKVESALDARGRIQPFTQKKYARDEIGELTKSYSLLLARIQEYTEYLQMLGSKLSHELRTPLAVIKSSLENLSHQPLDQQAQTYADRALTGTERLAKILTAMTAANRLEQSLQYADLEPVDMNALLCELTEAYRDIYPDNAVTFTTASPEQPLKCSAGPELIVQMMDKLVENAVDFSPSGAEVKIHLQAQAKTLVISVINFGSRLPEVMNHQIFDSLVSLRPDDQQHNHFGLGLYIVRIIVRFHGGTVRAFNDPNNSAVVFEVRLPLISAG